MSESGHFSPSAGADAKCSDGSNTSSTDQGYFAEFNEQKTKKNKKPEKITVNDCMVMIKSKCALLKFITMLDIKVTKIGEMQFDGDMQKVLAKLVDYLYHFMFRKFPVEPAALKDYLEFRNEYEQFLIGYRDLLEKLMSKKHSNPEVYITAAIYQYSIRLDFDKASHYFKLGLKNHKKCKELYIEFFWMEIQLMEKQNRIHFCVVLKKYKKCIKKFKNDLQFHLQLLKKLITCDSNKFIQNIVVSDIKAKFGFGPMCLKLAEICFDNFTNDQGTSAITFDGQRMLHKTSVDGIKGTQSIKKRRNLWNLYVDYMIEVWKSIGCSTDSITLLMNKITQVFRSEKKNEAPQEYYVYLAEYCSKNNQAIFKEVIEMNKDNPEVWADFILTYNTPVQPMKDCVQLLKEDSVFWEMMDLFLENNECPGKTTFFGNDRSYFMEENEK